MVLRFSLLNSHFQDSNTPSYKSSRTTRATKSYDEMSPDSTTSRHTGCQYLHPNYSPITTSTINRSPSSPLSNQCYSHNPNHPHHPPQHQQHPHYQYYDGLGHSSGGTESSPGGRFNDSRNFHLPLRQESSQCPKWKCFIKKDSCAPDHVILTFTPASFDDLLLLEPCGVSQWSANLVADWSASNEGVCYRTNSS